MEMSKSEHEEELYKTLIDDDEEDQLPLKPKKGCVCCGKDCKCSKDCDCCGKDCKCGCAKKTSPPVRSSSGCGCCCKCVLICFALVFLMGVVVTMSVYSAMSDAVQHLTVTTPHDKFPIVEMTDKELNVVKARVELFVDQLIAGNAQESLTVTQDEINGFIGHSDYLRGNMFITLKDGSIEEEYSLPTDMLPGGADRYFVASDYLKVEEDKIELKFETAATHHDWFDGPLLFAQLQYLVSKDNLLELYLLKGSLFGQEAAQDFIDQHQNLLADLFSDPDSADAKAVMENIEEVRIEDGKIVVKPRKNDLVAGAW